MNKTPRVTRESFESHLRHLRDARQQADEALVLLGKTHKIASDVLIKVWEFLFAELTKTGGEKFTLGQLSTSAGIIYKLSQSAQQLKTTEHQTRDYEEGLAERLKRVRAMLKEAPGLTPELREELERELRVLS